ncbi:thioesterase domain-containing protein [Amycolatopsis aidingensis]|uniref:thioesterase domain-containing protein n=1 Tax=Amycolatopsis aidingensis TaxID=2842453 RepID=UPI001C0BFAD9|nr:thioesterase domain-containing protein [Amycolatopsis aidingensis]
MAPHLLAGWSFGGVVSQEMAVALEDLGEEVPVLILFDAPPVELGNEETAKDLPEDVLSLIEQSIRCAAGGILDDLPEGNVAKLSAMTDHCVRPLGAHESRAFGGKVVSVEAAGSQDAADRSRPWWAHLAQGGVATYSIDCQHEEMMNVEPVLSIGKSSWTCSRGTIRRVSQRWSILL